MTARPGFLPLGRGGVLRPHRKRPGKVSRVTQSPPFRRTKTEERARSTLRPSAHRFAISRHSRSSASPAVSNAAPADQGSKGPLDPPWPVGLRSVGEVLPPRPTADGPGPEVPLAFPFLPFGCGGRSSFIAESGTEKGATVSNAVGGRRIETAGPLVLSGTKERRNDKMPSTRNDEPTPRHQPQRASVRQFSPTRRPPPRNGGRGA